MAYYIPNYPIDNKTCIGDSLQTINASFSSLDTNLYTLSSYTHTNINTLSAITAELDAYTYGPVGNMAEIYLVYDTPDNRLVLNNTIHNVLLNTVAFDVPGGMADIVNNRILIKKSGYYEVTVHAAYEAGGNAASRLVVLGRHFTFLTDRGGKVGNEQSYIIGTTPTQEGSRVLYLNYNDSIKLDVYQNSGATMQLKTSNDTYQVGISVVEINPDRLELIIPLFDRRVVGYGDSNTEGRACGPDNVYGEWLTSNFINRGVFGITSATIADTLLSNIASDANLQSDFILASGINDLGYTATPNISVIANKIKTILDTARPLYKSITWITPSKTNYSYTGNATINTNITLLVNAVIALAIPSIRIVRADLDTQIGMSSDPNAPLLKSDGLHYTRKGHKLLANLVYPIIV